MNDILTKIALNKRIEVENLKIERPLDRIRVEPQPEAEFAFRRALSKPGINIIAELKKGSPSRGVLREDFDVPLLARQYREGGAAALSVLTDRRYFFGRPEYLAEAGRAARLPVLCKEFIIDRWQLHFARTMQADAVLLIAALLSQPVLADFIAEAESIGLDCLVEVHSENEVIAAIDAGARMIGVNNRNLKTFEVSLTTSERLAGLIPGGCIKVAESGIFSHDDIFRLQRHGYNCFLIGESLVTSDDPVALLRSLRGV
jgi:indole-3-glycerol phosphate synthase